MLMDLYYHRRPSEYQYTLAILPAPSPPNAIASATAAPVPPIVLSNSSELPPSGILSESVEIECRRGCL